MIKSIARWILKDELLLLNNHAAQMRKDKFILIRNASFLQNSNAEFDYWKKYGVGMRKQSQATVPTVSGEEDE